MRFREFAAYLAVVAAMGFPATGCNQSASAPTKPTTSKNTPKATSAVPVVVAPKPEFASPVEEPLAETKPTADSPTKSSPAAFTDPQAAELTMPTVALSDGHAKLCRVRVGDQLPDFQLTDLEGKAQSLGQLLGPKLTVVTFWTRSQPSALEELADLSPDILDRFSQYGVGVVGINEADDPQSALEIAQQAKAQFPNLSDRDGSALGQVATAKLPRTYLIDSSRNILWFDLEYSRTTRRELAQAIRFWLAHNLSASHPSP
jgi:peroxiredoxin